MASGTSSAKFDVVKIYGTSNFGLWQKRMKDFFVQQGMVKVVYGVQLDGMNGANWKEMEAKMVPTIRLCMANDVLYNIMEEDSLVAIWKKLESWYMSKSLANKLFLQQRLYWLKMLQLSIFHASKHPLDEVQVVDVDMINECVEEATPSILWRDPLEDMLQPKSLPTSNLEDFYEKPFATYDSDFSLQENFGVSDRPRTPLRDITLLQVQSFVRDDSINKE
ncbi:uncharacterized protein LOC131168408 [Malania oleifera]|uniref:uncharacterized protein LOC131168408 n=1 Tax=Malania oleifera TaxID=397392 RepID=UPI0025AE6F00|nr:uncharacterized protein LOC131168408 [Malania oleifera]